MRVNVYAEEMTERVEIISKEIDGQQFTGLRLYLELPVTLPDGNNASGPFIHRPGDDDSAAITFWGKRDLRAVLHKMLIALDSHYLGRDGVGCARLESEARVAGGWMFIGCSVDTLAHAARHSEYVLNAAEDGTHVHITREEEFARSVARALNDEAEDGSTPISRMLDKAFEHVIEYGDDGFEVQEVGDHDH